MEKKWMFWKDKRLVKHQVAIVIISFLLTLIAGFVVADNETHLNVYTPIVGWEDIIDYDEPESSGKNINLERIRDLLTGYEVDLPWEQLLFHIWHWQIYKSGDVDYDISYMKESGFSGWPFQFLFKYEVKTLGTSSVAYAFYECGPLAFVVDWIILYLVLCLTLVVLYTVTKYKNKNKG